VALIPNKPKNIATATSLTNGEVIRNEKVTPRGIPPFTNPINKGMDEQEQNGVIAPKNDAKKYCSPYIFLVVRYIRSRSMGKYAFTTPISELIRNKRIKIFIVS
jgi:hypothetical protein